MTRRNIARLTEAGDTGWDAFRARIPLIEVASVIGHMNSARARVPGDMWCVARQASFEI